MKTKTIVIIAVVVVVLGIAGYFLWKKYKGVDSTAVKAAAPNATSEERALGEKFLSYLPAGMASDILRQYSLNDPRVQGMTFPRAIYTLITFQQGIKNPVTVSDQNPGLSEWSLNADKAIIKAYPELAAWEGKQILASVK